MSEVVGALSTALDVTEGQPPGHARRSCLIGMRLASALGLPAADRSSLFYALLMKDAGCSTNSAPVAELYGHDDGDVKRDRKLTDHLRPGQNVGHLIRATAPGRSPLAKARHLRALVANGSAGARALMQMRCERGADIARSIELDDATALAIHQLDEHWDGRGYPDGLAGEEISLLGRIACLAQTVEVFWNEGGRDAAVAVARERAGRWFDPALVRELERIPDADELWSALERPDVRALEPSDLVMVASDARLDRIAAAFASVVDAKSPYTATHSDGVARIAVGLARTLGLDPADQAMLRRAGLLHDLGKLAISNRILDKPGPLTDEEWTVMRTHPEISLRILSTVPAFDAFAFTAAAHHERLDGSGYPYGVTGTKLDLPARILAVADVAEALSAERPYRPSLPWDEVLAIIGRDAGSRLDARIVAALADRPEADALDLWQPALPSSPGTRAAR